MEQKTTMNNQYGLLFDEPSPEHYVFGSSSIPYEVLRPDGNWQNDLVVKELQSLPGKESFACVVFTLLNCLEILIKAKYGVEENYADAFLAEIAKTRQNQGSSPQVVCELLRKLGLPKEEQYPFQQWLEGQAPAITDALYKVALQFLDNYDFKHEFVPLNNEAITKALKSSPLMISVYAWIKNDKGLYYRPQGVPDSHATTLIYERPGEFRRVFDTYDAPHIKDVEWSAMPMIVKRFWVQKKIKKPENLFLKDLQVGSFGMDVLKLQTLLEEKGYGDFIPTGFFGEKTKQAVIQLQRDNGIIPTSGIFGPKTRTLINNQKLNMNREKIYQTALSLIGTDVSPTDNVPDSLDCANTVCLILKKAGFDIGSFPLTTDLYKALKNSPEWVLTTEPLRGDVIISPTGHGNGSIPNGHTGIVGDAQQILSNTSKDGILRANYTFTTWKERYAQKGGFPVYYFRKL